MRPPIINFSIPFRATLTRSMLVSTDTLNRKNLLFGRYSQFIINNQDPPWTQDPVAGNGNFATAYNIHERSVAVAWDTTLHSSLLNELRFGFNRDYAHSDPIGLQLGTSLAPGFGLTGIPVGPNTAGLPPIEINGLTRIGTSPWRPQFQISQVWQILEQPSWLKGNHSFKFGDEYRHWSNNFLDIRARRRNRCKWHLHRRRRFRIAGLSAGRRRFARSL